MKKFPGYRKALKDASQKTVDDLEKMFQKQWSNDETLNNGEKSYDDDGDDENYFKYSTIESKKRRYINVLCKNR